MIVSESYLNNNMYCWDGRTGALVGKHSFSNYAPTVSINSQWFVSGSYDDNLRIRDFTSGIVLGEPMLGHTGTINSIALSPDNQLIASASNDNTVRLWDVTTRKLVMTLAGHKDSVSSVVFSVDGNTIISGSHDRSARVWDVRTGEAVGEPLEGHLSWVRAVAVSQDGRWIASASDDRTARIWSTSSLLVTQILKGHSFYVMTVAFSPDNKFLVSGSWDKTIRIWNIQTGEAVGLPLTGHTDWINSVTFSPIGNEIASSSKDGSIRIWDARARTNIELIKYDETPSSSQLVDEELRVRWNASRARMGENNAWVRDGEKLLLWVPRQHRADISGGTRLLIAPSVDRERPEVDHRKLLRFSGTRWTDIYTLAAPK